MRESSADPELLTKLFEQNITLTLYKFFSLLYISIHPLVHHSLTCTSTQKVKTKQTKLIETPCSTWRRLRSDE